MIQSAIRPSQFDGDGAPRRSERQSFVVASGFRAISPELRGFCEPFSTWVRATYQNVGSVCSSVAARRCALPKKLGRGTIHKKRAALFIHVFGMCCKL